MILIISSETDVTTTKVCSYLNNSQFILCNFERWSTICLYLTNCNSNHSDFLINGKSLSEISVIWMEEDSVAGSGSVDSRNEAGFSVYDEWYDYNDNGIIDGNETWTGYGGYKPK